MPFTDSIRVWSKRLILVFVGLLMSLLLAEAGIRLLNFHFQSLWSSFTTRDPILGWALRPNARGWNAEGENEFEVNSSGNHDRERQVEKPANEFRIAVLGDSLVESVQVPLADTFMAGIERELSRCPALGGRAVEVLNFGVSGYGQAQELLMLRTRVWQFRPDLIILSVNFGNDLFDNYLPLDYAPPGLRPYFVYQGERLALDDAFRNNPRFDPARVRRYNFFIDVLNHSRLLTLINAVRLIFNSPFTEYAKRNAVGGVPPDYVSVWPYLPPSHPYHREAWRITEGLIVEIGREVRAHNAGFLVVTMPMARQVDPDLNAREVSQKEFGVDTLHYPDDRLMALSQQSQFAFLPLYEAIGAEAVRKHEYLTGGKGTVRGEGHLNRAGHRVAAAVLTQYLCEHFEK